VKNQLKAYGIKARQESNWRMYVGTGSEVIYHYKMALSGA